MFSFIKQLRILEITARSLIDYEDHTELAILLSFKDWMGSVEKSHITKSCSLFVFYMFCVIIFILCLFWNKQL